ncbi:MAG: helix-turn-helix domain-containing protein [Hyphomicrobiales bacterium]
MTERPIRHLNQVELARRWSLSHRTLERWRWQGRGPRYLKVGGRVVYRLEDIEAYEAAQFREPAAALAPMHKSPAAQSWGRA